MMDIGIRDASLTLAGFSSIPEGQERLGRRALEDNFPRTGEVTGPRSGETIVLDAAGCERYRQELGTAGIRVCALLCAQNFGLEPVEPEIDWIVRAVRAAEALGIGAVRVDSAMARQAELPLE